MRNGIGPGFPYFLIQNSPQGPHARQDTGILCGLGRGEEPGGPCAWSSSCSDRERERFGIGAVAIRRTVDEFDLPADKTRDLLAIHPDQEQRGGPSPIARVDFILHHGSISIAR